MKTLRHIKILLLVSITLAFSQIAMAEYGRLNCVISSGEERFIERIYYIEFSANDVEIDQLGLTLKGRRTQLINHSLDPSKAEICRDFYVEAAGKCLWRNGIRDCDQKREIPVKRSWNTATIDLGSYDYFLCQRGSRISTYSNKSEFLDQAKAAHVEALRFGQDNIQRFAYAGNTRGKNSVENALCISF